MGNTIGWYDSYSKNHERYIQYDWEGVTVEGTSSLYELSTDELASVLHGDKFIVQKGKVRLQEYEVTIKVNNFNAVTNKVIKHNEYELTKEEVIDISLYHVKQLSSKFTLFDESAVILCKGTRIEKD